MKFKTLNLGENIFKSIMEELDLHSSDFSRNLIVFPGKRPYYFLLNDIARAVCKSFIPPSVLAIDEFIDQIHEKELLIIDRKIDSLSASGIIYSLIRKEQLFCENSGRLSSFIPLGVKIFSLFEELMMECVSFEKLRTMDFLIDATKTKDNLFRLSDIYKKFYEEVKNRGFSTRSLRYRRVASKKLELKNIEKIIFAGFAWLTKTEKEIFDSLLDDERVLIIFQGQEPASHFKGKPLDVEKDYFIEKVNFFEVPDSHSQVFQLSDMVKDLIETNPHESILILSPSPDTLIPLINTLPLQFDKYNISLGYPLIRTPLFSFIKDLINLLVTSEPDGVYINDYLKFVLHPYTKNVIYKGSSEITRIILHSLEEKLREKRLEKFVSIKELESQNFLEQISWKEGLSIQEISFHLKHIHTNTISKFSDIRNIKSFAEKIREVIDFIYRESTAKRHILFFPYCEALIDCLYEIENSLIANESFDNIEEYFNFFKNYISYVYVPFKGTPIKPVQILGLLESRNLNFDNVFILDFNEGIFPDTEREDAILPFDVRVRLGLPTYKDRDRLYDYYLRNILAAARKVNIFYVENDNREKSRFVEKMIWEKQKKEKKLGRYHITAKYRFNLAPYSPKIVEKTDEIFEKMRALTFSATILDTYYECPLKFYYAYLLIPSEELTANDSLEKMDVGNLIHSFLRDYFDDKNICYDEKKFVKLLNNSFENYFGKRLRGEALILKYQTEKKLKEFISNYREKILEDVNDVLIIDLEKSFERKMCFPEIGELKFKGKIDRLEKRDGKLFIIDYKTSSRTDKYRVNWKRFNFEDRSSWKRSFKTIQLMFYINLLWEGIGLEKPYNASIIPLGLKDLKELKLFSSMEELENIYLIPKIIEELINDIFSQSPFVPAENKEICNYCDFKNFCYC